MMTSIVAGDQILFNKSDRFYGTVTITKSGTSGNEIVIGSYGSGPLPEITGKKIITGWTVHSGNIYKATLSATDTVANLYINNAIMTKARFPNTGFLRTDHSSGNTGFYDAALTQSNGYWNNADCKIRTKNWAYEIRKVSSFISGNVNFSSPTVYSNYTNYGYYFDNKLELIDVQDEWYHDKTTGILYFYAPGGVNPNTLQIEAVIQRYGVNSNNNYVKVTNIKISGYTESGIRFYSGNNKSILGCYITQTGIYGINLNGNNHIIENNTFEDNLSSGIFGVVTGGSVRYNIFNRTGLIPGYGASGSGYAAISAGSFQNSVIEFNNIDSSGYIGISIAKTNMVKNNILDYSCLVLNDGGGIYITNCDSLKIIGNLVFNTIGNYSTSGVSGSYSVGIYVNDKIMKNSTIQNNTVCYSGYMGILIDHGTTLENNKIIGNTSYNNFGGQILFTDYSATSYIPSFNTIMKHNIFYSLSVDQACLTLNGHRGSVISDYGTFDSNYYCNPYGEFLVRRTNFLPAYTSNTHTLDYWKDTYGKDLNSKSLPFSFNQFRVTDTLSGNLLSNSQFNTNINPWQGWPSGASLGWTTNPLLDSGCLRMRWNGIGYTVGFAVSNRYSITNGNYYLLSVSSAGNHTGTFSLWGFSTLPSTPPSFPQRILTTTMSEKTIH
ncbi:MAG: right-handed parallel beta-helix repeat-containing protein [Ignavibacteria bacterium]|nr:right-handed parallel beta-helix repeat-containing protein [Ignavibacteria bacterium]